MKTLEQIITEEKKNKNKKGSYGVEACKESIKWKAEHYNKSLYTILEELVHRANNEAGFNQTMVYACWLMINER